MRNNQMEIFLKTLEPESAKFIKNEKIHKCQNFSQNKYVISKNEIKFHLATKYTTSYGLHIASHFYIKFGMKNFDL